MIVDIERIYKLTKEIRKINSTPLNEIEFRENGKKILIRKEVIDEYFYLGLNNITFITSNFYKSGNNMIFLEEKDKPVI